MMTRKMSRIYIFLEYPTDIPHLETFYRYTISRDISYRETSHRYTILRDILAKA